MPSGIAVAHTAPHAMRTRCVLANTWVRRIPERIASHPANTTSDGGGMRTAACGLTQGSIHRLRASQASRSIEMEIAPATYRSMSMNWLLALLIDGLVSEEVTGSPES